MSSVHEIAVSGFGEGTNELYDRARPSYPPEALTKIHSIISESRKSSDSDSSVSVKWKIIEPGSGTGIFSRLLMQPPTPSYPTFPLDSLIGVEPSSGMRKAWTNGLEKLSLSAEYKEGKKLVAVQGGFDDFTNVQQHGIDKYNKNTKKGGADAVIIAQAWHWCPDHEKALEEIASYLPPSSPLILIWNLESQSTQWQKSVRENYQQHDLGSPQYYKGWWREMFNTKAYKDLFEEKVEWSTEWGRGITEDGLIDNLFSKSYLTPAHLSGDKRQKLDSDLRNIIREADHEWINKDKGIFVFKYSTDIVVLRRKA
ncbi:uncharacterized protein IL334_000190 [Kwoniella shivajii]|uniref:Methyltransferase type 11 domain-containing protein n=1 Tax=Kwoniella shivajii TaxID=564305 RepID=A0ABZ1CNT3_9TREE|nr:hypothetical protein IL334_000190 [Kwoniella shivajii]